MRKSISRAARKAALAASSASTEIAVINPSDVATVESVLASDVHENGATVIDGATGETVTQPENTETPADDNADAPTETPEATEAKPDQSAARRAVIAADRAAVNALYAGFHKAAVSVPVKAISGFKPVSAYPHPNARKPSLRQAAAIATMLAASGNKLADGATFPRYAEIDGTVLAIENGCAADMLKAGLVTVSGDNPADETFTILPKQAAIIVSHISGKLARAAGILA